MGVGLKSNLHSTYIQLTTHLALQVEARYKTAMQFSSFTPHRWMRNRHLQTIVPSKWRRLPAVPINRIRYELDDGDFLDLDVLPSEQGPVVLLVHGLEGSSQSQYIQAMLWRLHRIHWAGVAMNLRGCSGELNRTARSYHSGETEDLSRVIDWIEQHFPQRPIALVGYSLGGSMALNWLAKHATDKRIKAACAVSVPYELDRCADVMDQGFARLYREHFLSQLKDKVARKRKIIEASGHPVDFDAVARARSFWEFDEHAIAPIHGFDSARHYYEVCSARPKLGDIRHPTLLIHALDDPFMRPETPPTIDELPDSVHALMVEKGGHIGFVHHGHQGADFGWLDRQIMRFLKTRMG